MSLAKRKKINESLFDYEDDNDLVYDYEYVDEIMSNCIVYYYNNAHKSHPLEVMYNPSGILDSYISVDNKQLNKGYLKEFIIDN
jgi:hypothetical protein